MATYRFTWHVVEEEIGRSNESGESRWGIAEGQGEPDGPVDQGTDAHIQPVLDQDVYCVLWPVSEEAFLNL